MEPLTYEPRPVTPVRRLPDDVAYWLPMGLFLACVWVGGQWPTLYVASYAVRVVVTAVALVLLRSHYTTVRWDYWWLGLIVGVVGIVQWVGMQAVLERFVPFFRPTGEVFNPAEHFRQPWRFWSFAAVRGWLGRSWSCR